MERLNKDFITLETTDMLYWTLWMSCSFQPRNPEIQSHKNDIWTNFTTKQHAFHLVGRLTASGFGPNISGPEASRWANTSQLIRVRCVMFTGLRSYLPQIVQNFVHFVHGQISCYLLNCSHAALIGLHNLERVGMMYRSQEYNTGNAVPWPVSLVIRNRQAARSLYMYCRLAVRPAIVIGYTNVWFQFEG